MTNANSIIRCNVKGRNSIGSNYRIFRDLIEFRTSGSVKGVKGSAAYGETGRLYYHPEWRSFFRSRDAFIDYVVYSYDTPIAWHDKRFGWVVPEISYSHTTDIQQGQVRYGITSAGLKFISRLDEVPQ